VTTESASLRGNNMITAEEQDGIHAQPLMTLMLLVGLMMMRFSMTVIVMMTKRIMIILTTMYRAHLLPIVITAKKQQFIEL
jgi:hypothetical protein